MNTPLQVPSLLAEQPHRNAQILPIEDAWAIALTWHDCLRDKVLLELTCSGFAKRYEWIRFHIDISNRDEVCAARAAALTWFALSCCPGYGGRENPVFWKCVFSELSQRHIDFRRQQVQSITDAYGFFDANGLDFPRFKLRVHGDDASALLFCGFQGAELGTDVQDKLGRMVDALTPWLDLHRTSRRPIVSLDGVYSNYLVVKSGEAAVEDSDAPIEWTLLQFLSDASQSAHSAWPSPIFHVKELILPSEVHNNRLHRYQEILQSHPVEISSVSFGYRDRSVSYDTMASMVRDVLRLPGSTARARTSEIRLGSKGTISLPAFASALPMTTSVRSVEVYGEGAFEEYLEDSAIIWIAYALFHPDTPASTWRSLSIKDALLDDRCGSLVRAMARGNNLAAMLDGREPTSDGYYRARLAGNAAVREQPGVNEVAVTTPSKTQFEVEVCDVASDDPKQWAEWIRVVVPAYGLGWVQSSDVISVTKRPPAAASLTSLHVSKSYSSDYSFTNHLGPVLSVVGRRLVHLDLGSYPVFSSADDLHDALGFCPSLQSLAIHYMRREWRGNDLVRVLPPSLRELHFRLCDYFLPGQRRIVLAFDSQWTREAGSESLLGFDLPPSLHVLRISVEMARRVGMQQVQAIKHILSQPSSLRVFHWEDTQVARYNLLPYTETCDDTARRLEELGLPPSSQYVDTRLPASSAAAFVSVLQKQAPTMALELAKVIVEFARTRLQRLIVLQPDFRHASVQRDQPDTLWGTEPQDTGMERLRNLIIIWDRRLDQAIRSG